MEATVGMSEPSAIRLSAPLTDIESRHLEFLIAVYRSTNKSVPQVLSLKKLSDKHKVQAAAVVVLVENKWLSRRESGNEFSYKWLRNYPPSAVIARAFYAEVRAKYKEYADKSAVSKKPTNARIEYTNVLEGLRHLYNKLKSSKPKSMNISKELKKCGLPWYIASGAVNAGVLTKMQRGLYTWNSEAGEPTLSMAERVYDNAQEAAGHVGSKKPSKPSKPRKPYAKKDDALIEENLERRSEALSKYFTVLTPSANDILKKELELAKMYIANDNKEGAHAMINSAINRL